MTSQFGQTLLSSGHFASKEVKTHLQSLSSEKASLLAMWEDGREQFEQCLELQLFMRRHRTGGRLDGKTRGEKMKEERKGEGGSERVSE